MKSNMFLLSFLCIGSSLIASAPAKESASYDKHPLIVELEQKINDIEKSRALVSNMEPNPESLNKMVELHLKLEEEYDETIQFVHKVGELISTHKKLMVMRREALQVKLAMHESSKILNEPVSEDIETIKARLQELLIVKLDQK